MSDAIFWPVISFVVMLACVMLRPTTVRAPRGWTVEGVRPSGETTMVPVPPRYCEDEADGEQRTPCPDDPRAIDAQIFCDGGTVPIVADERTVRCQRQASD